MRFSIHRDCKRGWIEWVGGGYSWIKWAPDLFSRFQFSSASALSGWFAGCMWATVFRSRQFFVRSAWGLYYSGFPLGSDQPAQPTGINHWRSQRVFFSVQNKVNFRAIYLLGNAFEVVRVPLIEILATPMVCTLAVADDGVLGRGFSRWPAWNQSHRTTHSKSDCVGETEWKTQQKMRSSNDLFDFHLAD